MARRPLRDQRPLTVTTPTEHPLTDRVRTAHGDAWQLEGTLRTAYGGGVAALPGIRLMASGIPAPQWNNGDVTDPALVDLDAVRQWYGDLRVPWGVRVPLGAQWPHGRHLFRKRCMAVPIGDFRPAPTGSAVEVVAAGPDDLPRFATVDAEAFGSALDLALRWVQPHLTEERVVNAMALVDGEPVGVATGVRTSGAGGECVAVFGVGVLPGARRRGIGALLSTYALGWGFASGADLGWLNPDTDEAARLYERLGFVETGGFDIYVDM